MSWVDFCRDAFEWTGPSGEPVWYSTFPDSQRGFCGMVSVEAFNTMVRDKHPLPQSRHARTHAAESVRVGTVSVTVTAAAGRRRRRRQTPRRY
jgi:hypothetical protein